jgi:hypothetical protein
MKICGLDLSMNSSGITKFILDDDLNIIHKDYIGFSTTKKLHSDKIYHYKKDEFVDELDKNIWFKNLISQFIMNSDYVAIEGYSYGSFGINFEIGEFCGLIKHHLYENSKNTKIRIYDINTIKLFGTGKGSADKLDMYEAFLKSDDKYDISNLPIVEEKHRKKGISPTSDVVDSFHICKLLLTELKLRRGLIHLKELDEKMIMVFNRTTKAHPTNILATDFLYKGND